MRLNATTETVAHRFGREIERLMGERQVRPQVIKAQRAANLNDLENSRNEHERRISALEAWARSMGYSE